MTYNPIPIPAQQTKRCPQCRRRLPLEEFYSNTTRRDGHSPYCKTCTLGYQRTARQKDLHHRRRWEQASAWRKRYGLEPEEYERLLEKQGGVCAICGRPETRRHGRTKTLWALSVDHDPETGAVRGLLCAECNPAIGLFRHDLKRLRAAIRYLQRKQP